MTVAILTDSAAALPARLAAENAIAVVPIWIAIGGRSVRDGEIAMDELLASPVEDISTSAPTPGDFADAIAAGDSPDGSLVLTVAATMSSSFQSAVAAAREAAGSRVRVMDTGTAAGAQGLVALAAARAARRGLDLDAVEAAALRAAAAVRLVATVDSLERFVRSGRVPGVAGWAGERLRVNPMFEFRQGEVRTLRPVIGKQAALDRILSKWRRTVVPGAALHVAALHGAAEDRGQRLLDAVLHESYPETAFLGAFSAGMIAHTGPGVVGLAWWWDAIST